ncbi:MAG: RNA polymerase sigma factor [Dehalococcoidales bacterium]|nr:RNA polymerase sigma factor [Dehalococcoidales bacterium]
MEESTAVASMKAGNVNDFAVIIENYQVPIVRYLYRVVGDQDTANDLAQDTFIQAYKAIIKTSPDLHLKSWLYKIATNNVRQYYRRKSILRFVPFSDHKNSLISSSQQQSSDIERNIEVRRALSKVPLKIRTCLVLHFVEGFKYREIAVTLGISEDAVRMRVARGREIFRQVYGGGETE